MNSKIGFMLARNDRFGYTLFPAKSVHREQFEQPVYDAIQSGTYAAAPGEALLNPLATDFVWPSKQQALESDGEISQNGIVLRVEAYWPYDAPNQLRPEGHFVPNEVIVLGIA